MNYSVKPKGQPMGDDYWGEEDDELLRAAKEQVDAALQIAKLAEERANRIADAKQRKAALDEIEALRRQCQLVKEAAIRYNLLPSLYINYLIQYLEPQHTLMTQKQRTYWLRLKKDWHHKSKGTDKQCYPMLSKN